MSAFKILLISGYDATSHRYWRNTLESQLDMFEWTQVALPARHFSWRVRGSALNLFSDYFDKLNQHYDLLIVTSMVDLAAIRGLFPKLTEIPNILYFHENQFVYPISKEQPNILNAQLTSFYSALCADEIWFNSEYNRTSYRNGLTRLLKQIPDKSSVNVAELINSKSAILPVPLLRPEHESFQQITSSPHILWNHRWEYDKCPEVFFDALRLLKQSGAEFTLSVVGESFRKIPECFAKAQLDFKQNIINWGHQSRSDYLEILRKADIVVSTANHDFQGLSMLEAISYGCLPIAPKRLVYPEYIPEDCLYSDNGSRDNESKILASLLDSKLESKNSQTIDISRYYGENLIPRYHERMNFWLANS